MKIIKYRIKENKVNKTFMIEGLIETKILFIINKQRWVSLDRYGNEASYSVFSFNHPYIYLIIQSAKEQIEIWKSGNIKYHEV